MEQRNLKVLGADKTFFGKITNTITKLLIPTQVGFNGIMINIKRNNMLKIYENYVQTDEKELTEKRYEESYALYLEAIDKFVMDSIYKKVKNGSASDFEREALSKYYTITGLKESEYLEYKYKKQKYLLELDYETLLVSGKEKQVKRYNKFYIDKMDSLFKGLLKNYSVKLADKITNKFQNNSETYDKIFATLEEYITDILPIKIENGDDELHKKIFEDYEKFERFSAGKFDEKDYIEKKMVLLGISRSLFTHSLPLVAAEQCYVRLLKEIREVVVTSKNAAKQKEAYALLIYLMDDYNIKLLSTKVYWDNPKDREEYKNFWSKYQATLKLSENEKQRQKEILFIRYDLKALNKSEKNYSSIKKIYKDKLVEYGVMKTLKNSYRTCNGGTTKKCRMYATK